jgi:hypothetical protein
MKLEDVEKMAKECEILPLDDVKFYTGRFTGKLVRRTGDPLDFKDFKKDEEVLVFHKEEFEKFFNGLENVLEIIENLKKLD